MSLLRNAIWFKTGDIMSNIFFRYFIQLTNYFPQKSIFRFAHNCKAAIAVNAKSKALLPIESFWFNRLIVIIFAYFNCKNNRYNCFVKAYQNCGWLEKTREVF